MMTIKALREILQHMNSPQDVARLFRKLGYFIEPVRLDAVKAYGLPADMADEYWLLGDTKDFQIHFFRLPADSREIREKIIRTFQHTDKFHLNQWLWVPFVVLQNLQVFFLKQI